MTATEELRRLLDERGVEWMDDSYAQLWCTVWHGQDGKQWRMTENQSGMLTELKAWKVTPAQAIAATLGSEDTYTREDVEGAFVSGYSLGLDMFDSSKPDNEKGWNQNELNLDEEMEDLGWVRKDAAKLGVGTCKNAAPSYLDFLCSECGFVHYHSDENDSGDNEWHFCPECGRKVVDE